MIEKSEFELHEWFEHVIGTVLKDIGSQVDSTETNTESKQAVKDYWLSFAKNTINTCEVISYLPHCYSQVIMSFRLLQETSADIYYLKINKGNLNNLAEQIVKAKEMIESGNITLRNMANTIVETDIRTNRQHGTQVRLDSASRYIGDKLDERLTADMHDINKLLNGYSHFNPTAIYWHQRLTNHGYLEVYMKLLHFYPAWLFLVLVSISDLLDIDDLNEESIVDIINDLLVEIEKSEGWSGVVFASEASK